MYVHLLLGESQMPHSGFFYASVKLLCRRTDQSLRAVAKRKTLFDDRPVEIAELTYVIKQDLSSLNSQISSLQSLSKSQAQVTRNAVGEQEGEHNKNVYFNSDRQSDGANIMARSWFYYKANSRT